MKDTMRVAALLLLTSLVLAAVVALAPGLDGVARSWMGYHLTPTPGTPGAVVGIAVHNSRAVLALGILSVLRAKLARTRLLDLLVYLDAAVNAALVGVAFGAYGTRGVPYLTHVPMEWMAMAAALVGYSTGHRRHLVHALVMVMLAAVWETYLTPQ